MHLITTSKAGVMKEPQSSSLFGKETQINSSPKVGICLRQVKELILIGNSIRSRKFRVVIWKSVPTKKCVSECGNGIPFPILYTADI